MGTAFWIRRFPSVLAGAFLIITAAQVLQGHALVDAASMAAFWATVSSGIFTLSRLYSSRRNRHCALCRDTPEMQ